MILKNKLLIISYIPYVYKNGGFCITLNPKSEIKKVEIDLRREEIDELIKTPIQYKNSIPDYKELLNKYFDELLNFNPIL